VNKDNKSPSSHQHSGIAPPAAAVKTLTPSTTSTTASTAMMMMSYNSPDTSVATSSGWYSTTHCAASRYRSLLLPTPEYHLPVPANCHMNGTNNRTNAPTLTIGLMPRLHDEAGLSSTHLARIKLVQVYRLQCHSSSSTYQAHVKHLLSWLDQFLINACQGNLMNAIELSV